MMDSSFNVINSFFEKVNCSTVPNIKMELFESTPNVEFVRRRLLALVESTALPLSNARRLALLESCRQASTGPELLDMALEAVGESTVIPDEIKDRVMDGLLTGNWDDVQNMVNAENVTRTPHVVHSSDRFVTFRRMAINIFYASRKIQQLPLAARRHLGSAILRTTNRDELMHLFLTRLTHATTLDEDARLKIANDVLEGRYYRLLLPDRFDCENTVERSYRHLQPSIDNNGVSTTANSNDNDGIRVSADTAHTINNVQVEHVWIDENTQDCPICLGQIEDSTTLQCQHVFCRDCILDWAHESHPPGLYSSSSHQQQVSCPICRQCNVILSNEESAGPSPNGRRRTFLPRWNIFRSNNVRL